jgi:hypothetical protein
MTKFTLFFIFGFLFLNLAQAEVLIQAPTVNNDTFGAVPQTDPSYISLVDQLSKDRPSKAESTEFESKIERAQNLFVSGSEEQAQKAFLQICKLSRIADWNASQREALFYAFLRAAQLTKKNNERDDLMDQAARFAPDLDPDTQLFPPPFLTTYRDFRSREQKASTAYQIDEKFAGYDLVIVDGRRYETDKQKEFLLTPGEHRISLISNSRLPLTLEMNSSQLSVFRADSKPLALGSCEEPAISGLHELNLEAASVMYGPDCIRSFTGTIWLKNDGKAQQIALLANKTSYAEANNFSPSLKDEALMPSKISNKTWLWIGAGTAVVAASAFFIIQNQRSHRGQSVQPSVHEGF